MVDNLLQKRRNYGLIYSTLLNFTRRSQALMGEYREIHSYNREHTPWYNDRVFSFVRWKDEERLIIVSNFDARDTFGFELQLPRRDPEFWNLRDGAYQLKDQLTGRSLELSFRIVRLKPGWILDPLESLILKFE